MRIAIIGAGLSGVATAYYLKQAGCDVHLFDKGGGASRASTGLLHPYPGKQCKKSWMADEAMLDAKNLLNAVGVKPREGILRILDNGDHFFIREGLVVDVPKYLDAFNYPVKKCEITSLNELQDFDHIVIAAGAKSIDFANLPVNLVKGQVLICEGRLEQAVISKGYIAPRDEETFFYGSTYEHNFENDKPNLEVAKKQLTKHVPIGCQAGIRVTRKGDYKPLMQRLNEKTWVLTAMGSRGLLYHAYFGKLLAKSILSS